MAKLTAAILAATAGAAAAFAPASRTNSPSALSEFANGMVGAEGAEPMPFRWGDDKTSKDFDPIGFSERAPEWLPWFREAELKHGRISMLACLGMVAPEFVRVPGEMFSVEKIPNVIDAHNALIDTSMKQILLWIGLAEAMSLAAVNNMGDFDRAPGDYGFDPLGLFPDDPAKQDEMRLKELKNGRLAMVSIGGMIHGAIVSGHGFPYV